MPKSKSQSDKFKEAAKAAVCSEDEAAFNEKLKKVIKKAAPVAKDGSGSKKDFKKP